MQVNKNEKYWEKEAKKMAAKLGELKIKCNGCKYKVPGGDYRCGHCCRKERVDFYEPIV